MFLFSVIIDEGVNYCAASISAKASAPTMCAVKSGKIEERYCLAGP